MSQTEHAEQKALVSWFKTQYPRGLIFSVPNMAKRSMALAAYLKAEGMSAGVPDLVIPMPRGGYHGLFIEMKKTKGDKPTDSQQQWLDNLSAQGYKAECCKGADIASELIRDYLASKITITN